MNSGSVWEKENMDGINLGLTKMAESCPGTTRASLENMQAWYIRDKTYLLHWLNWLMPRSHVRWRHYGETVQPHLPTVRIFGLAAMAAMRVRST